jgi:two-component system phosphate regulon sensor histidine kinase PhoR
MASREERNGGDIPRARGRALTPASCILGAAVIVFAALAGIGALAPAYALLGFAALLAASLLGRKAVPASARSAPPGETTLPPPGAGPELLIGGIADPAIVLDRAGTVLAFNAGAGRIAPALDRGKPVSLALRMPAVVEAVRRAGASGQAQRTEFSERGPVDRWYEAHVVPLAPARESAGLMLLTLRDLTPLRRSEQMRAEFVANASHELRTPLASLSGFIDTLQGRARDDPAARARFLEIMKGQARRMARLIDDLLSLSRIELTAHIHPETPVELAPVLLQVVDSLQVLARERGVEVALAAPAEPVIVPGDRDELIRVFENLIENALKYGALGKRVDVRLDRAAAPDGRRTQATVSIQDYGPGIAAEHLPRLTERFYRVDVGQSRAEGGTGLGLALVKHILNRHQGRLATESTAGAGATFTVYLPLAQSGIEQV